MGEEFAASDSDDWSAEEQAALAREALAEWEQALVEAGGDREHATQLWVKNRLARLRVPEWHPDRVEYIDGVPPWHPEADDGNDGPEGGVREPRHPSPESPSGAAALEEPTSE